MYQLEAEGYVLDEPLEIEVLPGEDVSGIEMVVHRGGVISGIVTA